MKKLCLDVNGAMNDISFAFERCLEHLVGVYANEPPTSKHPKLAALSASCGLHIVSEYAEQDHNPHKLRGYSISYKAPSEEQKDTIAKILENELALYHTEVIRRSRVERIILASNLKCGEQPWGGLAEVGWLVADTLFLNVERLEKNEVYARRAFHHEFYHAIDYRDSVLNFTDSSWNRLNASHFRYKQSTDPTLSSAHMFVPGFVSAYSLTNVREDKAEVFSHLIVHYDLMIERAKQDQVLANKIARMKMYLAKFAPQIDDAFWQSLKDRSPPLQYASFANEAYIQSLSQKGGVLISHLAGWLNPYLRFWSDSNDDSNDSKRTAIYASLGSKDQTMFSKSIKFESENDLRAWLIACRLKENWIKTDFLRNDYNYPVKSTPELLAQFGLK